MTSEPLYDQWTRRVSQAYGVAAPRVVLADGDDPRVREACTSLLEAGVAPILLGASHANWPQEVDYIDLADQRSESVTKVLVEIAQRRGWDEQRVRQLLSDPLYVAAAMVRAGEADAAVGGAARPSGDVIRASLHVLGLRKTRSLLSSCFMMQLNGGRHVAFADCAVVPDPDAAQLADIAVTTADTYRTLTGESPQVAMLSFSTHGSAAHPDVDLVREATTLARQRDGGLSIDGDLQFDAAFVQTVGAHKCPNSQVAGHANVFVFPNLAAGNIGYKIAQRVGGALAYGPILQGLQAPMNDLSRGCESEDVASVALISALQATA